MKSFEEVTVSIPAYPFEAPIVSSIQQLLHGEFSELFLAVIVHGSIATNEIVPYSDFDGLLIVKEDHLGSPKLREFKRRTLRLIYEFDPLQHHGWFELSEAQMDDFPQDYFPYELLEHSKTIYPAAGLELTMRIPVTTDYLRVFNDLSSSVLKKTEPPFRPHNRYTLKTFISQILLLPSVYYAAREQKAIFKKYSFAAVQGDFAYEAWRSIERASSIRSNWNYQVSLILRPFVTRPERVFRKLLQKGPFLGLEPELEASLSMDFYADLIKLIQEMRSNLHQVKVV